MSGGVAYVLDETGAFSQHCNPDTVTLAYLDDADEIRQVKDMVRRHAAHTQSERAWKILAMWDDMLPRFVKVMPKDYQRMLAAIKRAEAAGLSGEAAVMEAFEENKNDVARVSGN
jgi:glutamate synthase (ferredoxin)